MDRRIVNRVVTNYKQGLGGRYKSLRAFGAIRQAAEEEEDEVEGGPQRCRYCSTYEVGSVLLKDRWPQGNDLQSSVHSRPHAKA